MSKAKLNWPATAEELRTAGYRRRPQFEQCPSCEAQIIWARNPYGKTIALEQIPDESPPRFQSHFSTCFRAEVQRLSKAKEAKR
ncbi:MAG: hypothetical protein OXC31_26660 [Spirochaetaceae bacterium]|nr:hypothetical protein [Spirochaetaceae bacterium]